MFLVQAADGAYDALMTMLLPAFVTSWIVAGILVICLILLGIALYIYMALVLTTLAKKLDYDKHWLAWIPIANLFLIPILAKKNWAWGFIFLVPIVNIVFYIIWSWNIFEQRKYPGWLALIVLGSFIPFLNWIAQLANLVIWGIVAWRDK